MKFPRPSNFPYKEVFYYDGEIALLNNHQLKLVGLGYGLKVRIRVA